MDGGCAGGSWLYPLFVWYLVPLTVIQYVIQFHYRLIKATLAATVHSCAYHSRNNSWPIDMTDYRPEESLKDAPLTVNPRECRPTLAILPISVQLTSLVGAQT